MAYNHEKVAAELASPEQEPVLELVPDLQSATAREQIEMEAMIPDSVLDFVPDS